MYLAGKIIELDSNVASFNQQLGEIVAKKGKQNKAIAPLKVFRFYERN